MATSEQDAVRRLISEVWGHGDLSTLESFYTESVIVHVGGCSLPEALVDTWHGLVFVNPDPATVVTCIPACVSEDRPARYEPVTAGAFLAQRIDGSDEPYVDPGEGPVRRIATEKPEELAR